MVELSLADLAIAAVLVLLLALLSIRLRSNISQQLIIAAVRTAVQLTLVGLVLKALFANASFGWVMLMALIMLLVAGREVMARQERRFKGWLGYGVGTFSMFLSSFAVTVFALVVILGEDPWYTPQYAIPLLGMLLGNTMNGIAIAMDRLTGTAWEQRAVIEARLMLGERWDQAIADYRRQAIRSGMIPIINAMAAAGIVSLPGMMTGQILAGAPPVEAVKYQILIMFLITAGTGLGTLAAVSIGSKQLFDERQRLCLERLRQP
ncbi:MAG: iron export ABC transporter permease subunit FetB [Gammaproteobacteria bacterium]